MEKKQTEISLSLFPIRLVNDVIRQFLQNLSEKQTEYTAQKK